MNSRLGAVLDTHWQGVLRDAGAEPGRPPVILWRYLITPPFPAQWLVVPYSEHHYYAYAHGHDVRGGLADGVHVAGPWAQIEAQNLEREAFKVSVIADRLASLGIQGVRPIRTDELAPAGWVSIEERLKSVPAHDPSGPASRAIQDYYRYWAANNGVIARAIRPSHPGFFDWFKEQKTGSRRA